MGNHWHDDWPRNENKTTRVIVTRCYRLILPLMLAIYAFVLALEFQMNYWEAESMAKNPSYGPSVDIVMHRGRQGQSEWTKSWMPEIVLQLMAR